MPEQVDVVVLGMGPGGEDVAGRLAEAGLSVAGVEANLVGGECPYWGCIPSKMMIRAGNLLAEGRRIPGMAGGSEVQPDWSPVATRIRTEATDDWDDKVAVDRFIAKGGRLFRGRGRLSGPGRVVVGDEELVASRAVVVATGTRPSIPPIPGLAGTPYWTNHEAIEATEVPATLVVIGGGAIGLELAQVFSRFGSRVTVLEVADRLLAMEEPESSDLVDGAFAKEGIDVRTGVTIDAVVHDGSWFTVTVDGNALQSERLLVATGRRADLAELGVDTIGLDPTSRALEVDENLRCGSGLWAVGDVTGKGAFTHVSMYQARIAAADILGTPHDTADYKALPRVTFTDPEIGAVGLTEAQARERGVNVRTAHYDLAKSTRGWIHKAGNEGFIKLVENVDRGVLVGATSAGPHGGEVLGALAVAVHGEVPVDALATMIYAYPTFHRAIEPAVMQLR